MSNKNKINVAVIGATGYTGLDLILILSNHPKVRITNLCATKNLGSDIKKFDGRIKKKLPKLSSIISIDWSKLDLVFLSLPNGEAQKIIKKTFSKNKKLKFIDLSADFRHENYNLYEINYHLKHKAKHFIKDSIYSIPEFTKNKIKDYRIIANPGCYPTSIQLALIPLIKNNLIKTNDISIDSKSGYSGAGKNLEKKFKHKNLYSSIYAYSTKNHKHICEMDQQFFKLTKKKVNYNFNPHLLPTFRGILSSMYVFGKKGTTAKKLKNYLEKYYKKSKFVKIQKINSSLGSGNVINTNNCEISICETRIKNKYIIFSAIDNLVKGASGQAVQNMNLMYGYNEQSGLK